MIDKKVFTQNLDNKTTQNIIDYLFEDKPNNAIAEIDTVPDRVSIKNYKKYRDLMDYQHKNNLFNFDNYINIFAKLALYNTVKVSRTIDSNQPKYIDNIDELVTLLKRSVQLEEQNNIGFILILEEMQCIFWIDRDSNCLDCIVYFHDEKYREFVKNIVRTEGFYLR